MEQKLKELLSNSHSPYSKVQVSAIVVDKNGKEYRGVNVENAAFGDTICAERSAMMSAISNGVKAKELKEVHLTSSLKHHIYPCGSCRQVMLELLADDGKVFIYHNNETREYSLDQIIPFGVKKGSFGWK